LLPALPTLNTNNNKEEGVYLNKSNLLPLLPILPALNINSNKKEDIYLNKNNPPPLLPILPALNINSNKKEEIILEIPYFTNGNINIRNLFPNSVIINEFRSI
ncbi:hypothetical protein OFB51_23790, partial [Escherichia coli]|nr:hypothetical protein [Escherichia coli]